MRVMSMTGACRVHVWCVSGVCRGLSRAEGAVSKLDSRHRKARRECSYLTGAPWPHYTLGDCFLDLAGVFGFGVAGGGSATGSGIEAGRRAPNRSPNMAPHTESSSSGAGGGGAGGRGFLGIRSSSIWLPPYRSRGARFEGRSHGWRTLGRGNQPASSTANTARWLHLLGAGGLGAPRAIAENAPNARGLVGQVGGRVGWHVQASARLTAATVPRLAATLNLIRPAVDAAS